MKSKILAMIMLLSLATTILGMSISTVAAAAVLSITPTPVNKVPADVTSFFDVYVNIADVTNLFGLDIKVTWSDNTLITLDNDTSNTNTAALLDGVWGAGNWFLAKIESSGGGGGGGYYRYVALSTASSFTGTQNLMNLHFQIMRSGNIPLETTIHIDTFKLSDPLWTAIPATTVDGLFHMAGTTPDLEFVVIDPTPAKPFEYCKIFEVEVYATHVTQMTDFDLTILFNSELLRFVDIDYWGVFGTGSVVPGTGSVQVTGAGTPQTGDSILLFALTFHIEFDDRIEHIWRTLAPKTLDAQISVNNLVGEFSFLEGTVPITGITLPPPLTITVHLIRGDVGPVDGQVNVQDLRTVANFYDLSTPVKYDLTMDGIIDIFDLVVVATNIGYPP